MDDFSITSESPEIKAKHIAEEYFNTHSYLNKVDLDEFITLLGLNDIWSTAEEKQTIWDLFVKYAKNENEINLDAVNQGIDELFSGEMNDINIDESELVNEPSLNISALTTNNKDISTLNRIDSASTLNLAEGYINAIHNKNLLLYIKMLNEIFISHNDNKVDINIEDILYRIKERYSFIMIDRDDLERYLKLISQSINSSIDIVIDKELVKKVEEIIDLRLSNGNNGLNENGLHSTIVSIPFSLEGIIDKLKQYDKIAIDYINALKEFNSNAVLFGVLSNSFTMLIQSKSSLYHAMITKCNYGPNVRFEDHKRTNSVQGIPSQFAQQIMPPLQKENAALKSQLRSLTMQCDQLSKENFILKQKMRTNTSSGNTNNNDISNIDLLLWSPQKRKSLSTPKSNQNSPECIHNDINFVDQNATNNNNDFTKCLTYSQNNTSMANNITKHNYICSSTSDLVKQRRKTETSLNKHQRVIKSQNYLHSNGIPIDDTMSRKDTTKFDDFSNSRCDLFSIRDANTEKFLLETTGLNDTNNFNEDAKHKNTYHFNINSFIDGDFNTTEPNENVVQPSNENNNIITNIATSVNPKDSSAKKIYYKPNNSIKEEKEMKNDSISRNDSTGFRNNGNGTNNNSVNNAINSSVMTTVLDDSGLMSQSQERENIMMSENNKGYYDFLNLRNDKKIIALIKKNKDAIVPNELFTGYVNYMEDNLKTRKVILIITANHFFLVETSDLSCHIKINRNVLGYIDVSSKNTNLLMFHFENGIDLIIESFKRIELLYYLRDLYQYKKYGRLRFKYPKNFVYKKHNGTAEPIFVTKNKAFMITPNFENAQKIDYLYEYVNSFLSCKFVEKLVVLCSIGLMVFNDATKPPKEIIPIIGCKIKTVKVQTGEKKFYCFKLTNPNKKEVIFGETNKENIKNWIKEIEKFQMFYDCKMKGIETGNKGIVNNTFMPSNSNNNTMNNNLSYSVVNNTK